MEKENLIALIDLMRGLDEDEYRRLNQKTKKKLKNLY